MNLYAVPRMTRDIDIVAEIRPEDADKVVGLFQGDFYVEREDILEAARSSGSFNIIHNETLVKVDFMIRKAERYRALEFARRRTHDVAGMAIRVVAREDLILSKLAWAKDASAVQLNDAKNLVVSAEELYRAYLAQWADVLGVSDLLRKVLE